MDYCREGDDEKLIKNTQISEQGWALVKTVIVEHVTKKNIRAHFCPLMGLQERLKRFFFI